MGAIPSELSTDRGPPMTIPLRHFVVGLGFLVLAGVVGTVVAFEPASATAGLAHVHLALVGWVGVTIMGAMTQFVPVWSGTPLYSERLATWQLRLVAAGLVGFAGALLVGRLAPLAGFGALMLAGFWTFCYNLARTLADCRPYDGTERHFAYAVGFFALATLLGFLLALDFVHPVLGRVGLGRPAVASAHATLAVFGALVTTLYGAIYQLATMFAQPAPSRLDAVLGRAEEATFPAGVLVLAAGRLVAAPTVATVGGVLVAAGTLALAGGLLRRLLGSRVGWSPMLVRYAVVGPALAVWAVLALPAWLARPLGAAARFGAPGTAHLLLFGAVGFAVIGTLYHVVPFVIWVHRYSDRLGYEPVPMVDDLYRSRLASLEFVVTVVGALVIVLAEALGLPGWWLAGGGAVATAGLALFAVTLLLVVREHGPQPLGTLLLGRSAG